MARINLVILLLLGLFILNACGNTNLEHPANIDDQEAVIYKTGIISGMASPTVVKTLNVNDQLEIKSEKSIFQNVEIHADFDKKFVSLKASTLNNENKIENLVYEGEFDSETGFALLAPKNTKIKTKALIRCVESCNKLIADIGIKHLVNGVLQYESEQFQIEDNKVTKIDPSKQYDGEVREINPESSSVTTPPTGIPPSHPNPTQAKKSTTPQVVTKKPPVIEAEENDEDSPDAEMEEPGIDTGQYQDLLDDKLLDDGSSLKNVFSRFNLGDQYPGKAIGYYNRGSLQKGTDIMSNASSLPLLGFQSVDRSDKMYYGSGLLIKMIEDIGKMYAKEFPGSKFEVNDVSKKAGGYCGHKSHQNGLDADILLPKLSNGKFDYAKIWALVKGFYIEEKAIKATMTPDKPGQEKIGIMILSPVIMKNMCNYLKSSGEKDFSSAFSKLYQDTLVTSTIRDPKTKRRIKVRRYPHDNHIHMRALCSPHNPSCHTGAYTKSKFGICI